MTKIEFGQDIGKPMPEAFLTSHQVWDDFVSGIWSSLLKTTPITKETTVLEIGPGVSTKIGGALARCGFSGTLYVVDALTDVLDALKAKYDALLPNAHIIYIAKPLTEAYSELPDNMDIILANHILDDMLIHTSGSKALGWSKKYTHSASKNLQAAWASLVKSDEKLKTAKQNVTLDIERLFKTLQPKIMVLNQYPSATLNDSSMQSLNDHALDLLKTLKQSFIGCVLDSEIQKTLNTHPHYQNKHIGNNVLNAENWLVCKRK